MKIIEQAKSRATKWLSYRVSGAVNMVGQVGGVSAHKKPLLKLDPDYVLKPLQMDHRGIREAGFYELLNATVQKSGIKTYTQFITGSGGESASILDVIFFSAALLLGDPYAVACEQRILEVWNVVEKESKLLHRLYQFVPRYFGIVRHENPENAGEVDQVQANTSPYGIHEDCHILLNDVTINFVRPCVIDIKMGTQTYEPDAPKEKKKRERAKYKSQEDFGFRIIGKRIYQPSNKKSDEHGFVFYNKEFGRSLTSREAVKDAFLKYFGLETVRRDILQMRLKAITNILLKLRSLKNWFKDNDTFSFSSSSLLIAYEGEEGAMSENLDMVNVKMIDFGRVRRRGGGDPGYLKGLKTLSTILEELSVEWQSKVS